MIHIIVRTLALCKRFFYRCTSASKDTEIFSEMEIPLYQESGEMADSFSRVSPPMTHGEDHGATANLSKTQSAIVLLGDTNSGTSVSQIGKGSEICPISPIRKKGEMLESFLDVYQDNGSLGSDFHQDRDEITDEQVITIGGERQSICCDLSSKNQAALQIDNGHTDNTNITITGDSQILTPMSFPDSDRLKIDSLVTISTANRTEAFKAESMLRYKRKQREYSKCSHSDESDCSDIELSISDNSDNENDRSATNESHPQQSISSDSEKYSDRISTTSPHSTSQGS